MVWNWCWSWDGVDQNSCNLITSLTRFKRMDGWMDNQTNVGVCFVRIETDEMSLVLEKKCLQTKIK